MLTLVLSIESAAILAGCSKKDISEVYVGSIDCSRYSPESGDIYYYNDNSIFRYEPDTEKNELVYTGEDEKIDGVAACNDILLYTAIYGKNNSHHLCEYDLATSKSTPVLEYNDTVYTDSANGYLFYTEYGKNFNEYTVFARDTNEEKAVYVDIASEWLPETDSGVQTENVNGFRITFERKDAKDKARILSIRDEKNFESVAVSIPLPEVDTCGKCVTFYDTEGYGSSEKREKCSFTVENGKTYDIDALNNSEFKNSMIWDRTITASGDNNVVGIITDTKTFSPAGIYPQNEDIENEALFSVDTDTGESKILYETGDNTKRIVGYKDGIIYLYQDDKIYSVNVETKEKILIKELDHCDSYFFLYVKNMMIIKCKGEGKVVFHKIII